MRSGSFESQQIPEVRQERSTSGALIAAVARTYTQLWEGKRGCGPVREVAGPQEHSASRIRTQLFISGQMAKDGSSDSPSHIGAVAALARARPHP